MEDRKDIEDYFKDSLQDFKIDPSEETRKKLFFWLVLSNFFVRYRNFIIVSFIALLLLVGACFMMDGKKVNHQSVMEKQTHSASEKRQEEITVSENSSSTVQREKTGREGIQKEANSTAPSFSSTVQSGKEKAIKNSILSIVPFKVENTGNNEKKSPEIKESIVANSSFSLENNDEKNIADSSKSIDNSITSSEFRVNDSVLSLQKNWSDSSLADAVVDTAIAIAAVVKDTLNSKDTIIAPAKRKMEVYIGLSSSYIHWINRDSTLSLPPSFNFGAVAELNYRHYNFGAGILYAQQNLILEHTQVDTSVSYQYDPVYSYQMDSVLNPDSSYSYTLDSTYITTDTISSKETVSKKQTQNMSLTYFTVPLFIGWMHSFGRHDVGLNAGMAMSFLLYSNGKSNPYNTDVPRNFLLNGNIGLSYRYHLTHRFIISTGVNVRKNFSGWTTAYKQGNSGISANLGLLYKF